MKYTLTLTDPDGIVIDTMTIDSNDLSTLKGQHVIAQEISTNVISEVCKNLANR